MTDKPQAMSAAKAARVLGVSPPTMRAAMDSGEIPYYRLLSRRYVTTATVEAILRGESPTQTADVA